MSSFLFWVSECSFLQLNFILKQIFLHLHYTNMDEYIQKLEFYHACYNVPKNLVDKFSEETKNDDYWKF